MSEEMPEHDVIVIGGGASGMFAAIQAAERGKKVLILEKNLKLGEKLKISGGGRCNITNAKFEVRDLLPFYGDAEQFLYSPFAQFGVQSTFDWFESRGLPLVVQARDRAFPHTEKAKDVCGLLVRELQRLGIEVITNSPVSKISVEDGRVQSVRVGKKVYIADSYIIATGGMSRPETGSTGDGYGWLKEIGHRVTDPNPDIVPIESKEPWIESLAGTSLTFMKITFKVQDELRGVIKKFSKTGKILFTHFGLSGPLILNSAREVGRLLKQGEVTAVIDLYPDTDIGSLDKQILGIFEDHKNKEFQNVIKDVVPAGMGQVLLSLLPKEMQNKRVHSISKTERRVLVDLLKGFEMRISGLMGYDRAVVADGGVVLDEVDMATMRSRLFENMYLTGDMIHISRPSGGYSLQICWTTGFVAGSSV